MCSDKAEWPPSPPNNVSDSRLNSTIYIYLYMYSNTTIRKGDRLDSDDDKTDTHNNCSKNYYDIHMEQAKSGARRALRRHTSATTASIAEALASLPPVPVASNPDLESVPVVAGPVTIDAGGECNGDLIRPAAEPTEQEQDPPDEAVLFRSEQQLGVRVAPSAHLAARDGLYPAKNFNTGDVVCTGTSRLRRWVLQGEVGLSSINDGFTVKETRVRASRVGEVRFLIGVPGRDVWANMNSCHACRMPANVTASRVGEEMDDSYLTFVASCPLEAFSGELLWDFSPDVPPIAPPPASASPETRTKRKAEAPDAGDDSAPAAAAARSSTGRSAGVPAAGPAAGPAPKSKRRTKRPSAPAEAAGLAGVSADVPTAGPGVDPDQAEAVY